MPKVSKQTTSHVERVGPMESWSDQFVGDAYYAPSGHMPVVEAGTEGIEFSTAAEYAETLAVLEKNVSALQAG